MTTETTTEEASASVSPADALCERIFGSAMGFAELIAIYLGDRLGLYRALASGPATASELARRAGIAERYAREWLEHGATAGLLTVAQASPDSRTRRYGLLDGCTGALTDPLDLANALPLVRQMVAIARQVDALSDAFHTGGGVPWEAYGPDMIEGQAAINRPVYHHLLAGWLAGMPAVHPRLSAPGARVADLACGGAWSAIALARAYPGLQIDGSDPDALAIGLARAHVAEAGLGGRIELSVADAAQLGSSYSGRYDLVTIFEATHDLAQPVAVLRSARAALAPGGAVLVMDENVGDSFEEPGPFDAFFYAASIGVCLPAALAEPGAIGTGTVMRASALEGYARVAGFTSIERIEVDHPFFRFYLLRPGA